jgi:hypothetical protein
VSPRAAARASAVMVLLVASAVYLGVGVRSARATTKLIGWTAEADANPIDLVIDDASGLAGVHPLVEADLPEDQSDFESGPFGHGLASVLWPGATAGNLGSLTGELSVPPQLAPITGQLNDPVRAETFYPAGPASATYPSGSVSGVAEMSSHSDSTGVSAKAGLTDLSLAGLLTVQAAQGSTTAAAGDRATATAAGSFGGVSLLGGLLQIGASSSTASASSDGVTVTGKGTTHIGAITIAGQPVSVGTDGVVVASNQAVPGSALSSPVATVTQLISALNLRIVLLPQTETHQAPAEKITSGGLQISFTLPPISPPKLDCTSLGQLSVVCTLPGLLQGASITATLARVTATAIGTPPFGALPSGANANPNVVGIGNGSTGGGGSSGAGGIGGGVVPGFPPSSSGGSTPGGSGLTPSPQSLPSLTPLSLSRPVKTGLMAFLLVVAAAIGACLIGMSRNLKKPPLSTCILEDQ